MFEIGDAVVLKSGSPIMIVKKIKRNRKIKCLWLNNEKSIFFRYKYYNFNPLTIIKMF